MNVKQMLKLCGMSIVVTSAVIAGTTFSTVVNAQTSKTKAPKVKLTAVEANAIAVKKYPGKVEGKTPLENEEGHWQYGVMVRSGKTLREVMVDANTGKIANVEVTTNSKEAKEKADEAKAKKPGKPVKEEDEKNEKSEKKEAPAKKKG